MVRVFQVGERYRVLGGPAFIGEPFVPLEVLICVERFHVPHDNEDVVVFLAEDGSRRTLAITFSEPRLREAFESIPSS